MAVRTRCLGEILRCFEAGDLGTEVALDAISRGEEMHELHDAVGTRREARTLRVDSSLEQRHVLFDLRRCRRTRADDPIHVAQLLLLQALGPGALLGVDDVVTEQRKSQLGHG